VFERLIHYLKEFQLSLIPICFSFITFWARVKDFNPIGILEAQLEKLGRGADDIITKLS
jgi:hypothetical protein